MYRSALRSTPRIAGSLRQTAVATSGRRFASTSPADKKRTWKSSAVRWGLAAGLVYWYTTSTIFADQPEPRTFPAPAQFSDEDLPTVEAVVEQKRKEAEARTQKAAKSTQVAAPKSSEPQAQAVTTTPPTPDADTGVPLPGSEGSPEALEEEAAQQGAFNPETGEINWDCPCLGGMADGPCGEEFKAAFSCFVYSTEEPKGMDCIDRFQGMQDCFRKYPEIYGAELDDEEEAPADVDGAGEPQMSARSQDPQDNALSGTSDTTNTAATQSKTQVSIGKSAETPKVEDPIPKKAYDTTSENYKPKQSKDDVSYAAAAASGPKQTPQEAAAPQPPEIIPSESASTASLIDVDTPSVRTVPSDFTDQDIQTDTQASRIEHENKEEKARAEAELAKKKAANKARKADSILTKWFGELSDGASSALVVSNLAAVIGLSGWLGYKAWGLYERGRLGWKNVGLGLGILTAVGAIEGVFGGYLYKGKKKNSS